MQNGGHTQSSERWIWILKEPNRIGVPAGPRRLIGSRISKLVTVKVSNPICAVMLFQSFKQQCLRRWWPLRGRLEVRICIHLVLTTLEHWKMTNWTCPLIMHSSVKPKESSPRHLLIRRMREPPSISRWLFRFCAALSQTSVCESY